MVCIYCRSETKVVNSRERARNPSVWRRRQCKSCVAQFSTNELPEYTASIVVRAPSGLYPFSRDKLFLSLHKALGHRQDAVNSASELTSTVIGQLLNPKNSKNGLIEMKALAATAHKILKRFDPLAANTYKAYHKSLLK